MRVIKALLAFVVVIAVGVVAFMAYAWRTEIAPITQEPAPQFPKALMQSGADLAAIGNCAICHTREGGVALAGGRALETPFGRIYTTNITPDPETGIGRWSEAAFQRAMHEGVDREGRHLYPAFPYDHSPSLAMRTIRRSMPSS
jgi:mono/diheme cytochrome c family protein